MQIQASFLGKVDQNLDTGKGSETIVLKSTGTVPTVFP
jgi:hypothetical protein